MPRPVWLPVVEQLPPVSPPPPTAPTAVQLPGNALRRVFHSTFPAAKLAAAHVETTAETARFVARVRELDPANATGALASQPALLAHPAVQTALHEVAEKLVRLAPCVCVFHKARWLIIGRGHGVFRRSTPPSPRASSRRFGGGCVFLFFRSLATLLLAAAQD